MNGDLIKPQQVAVNDWPQLVPLDDPELPSLDLSDMPTWAGDYAKALSANTETPPELAAGMILAACATAAARRITVQIQDGYIEPCNLWIVAALPPGNRKSSVQSKSTAPLMGWQEEQSDALKPEIKRIETEHLNAQARIKHLRTRAIGC